VYSRLKALGVNCRVDDPFLTVKDNPALTSLNHVLQSDIITSHAPLTLTGEYPTRHLLDAQALDQLRSGTVLISAGRGAVIDNQALLRKLSIAKNIRVALDVWEGEPDILTELMPFVDIVTPHIAGHSLEGKENGTAMVYEKLCEFLQVKPPIDVQQAVNTDRARLEFATSELLNKGSNESPEAIFNQLLLTAYPIMKDDQQLRQWHSVDKPVSQAIAPSIAQHFDSLRKHYPIRREYTHFIFPDYTRQAPFCHWLAQLID
jgi:erythronate-4-phosphate dehydrogenase